MLYLLINIIILTIGCMYDIISKQRFIRKYRWQNQRIQPERVIFRMKKA